MKPYSYLLIDLACVIIPLIASFYPTIPFHKEWKRFFPACLLVALFFLIWDYIFTYLGVWGFNPDYLTGIYIANLPIEEILFFICIPYACVFTYFAIQSLVSISPSNSYHRYISIFLLIVLAALSLLYYDKIYTVTTFSLASVFLLYGLYKKIIFTYIYIAYLLIIPFFIISNGILTGMLVDAPIVWYNDQENIGIRILTIPIEDTVYGFLLIGLNIVLYNKFKFLVKG